MSIDLCVVLPKLLVATCCDASSQTEVDDSAAAEEGMNSDPPDKSDEFSPLRNSVLVQ